MNALVPEAGWAAPSTPPQGVDVRQLQSADELTAPVVAAMSRRLVRELSRPEWPDVTYARGAAGHLLALTALRPHPACVPLDAGWVAEQLHRLLLTVHKTPHGLFQGAEGTMLAALEIDRAWGLGLAAEVAEDLDAKLAQSLDDQVSLPAHFDLISGLSGMGLYGAYRAWQGHAPDTLARLVDRLLERASSYRTPAGQDALAWFTAPELLRGQSSMADRAQEGCFDLGQAHGQGGPLTFLATAVLCGDPRASTREALRQTVAGLLAEAQEGFDSHFAYTRGERFTARCAWCYGDLGLIGPLRLAAQALGDGEVLRWSERLRRTALLRPVPSYGLTDAALCHGSAGVIWLLSLDAQAEDASRLDSVAKEVMPPGFQKLGAYWLERLTFDDAVDASLLEGHAGLALALAERHQAVSDVRWGWCLLPQPLRPMHPMRHTKP